MPENPQEQTEAKLLAYIEGELDDAGRADIERLLEANPKHRELLNREELAANRRLLRLLPREVAPVDLYDNIQSQFERQELLESVATLSGGGSSIGGQSFGDDGAINPDTGNFRLNRWGKLRAAAAIALLASGVGLVVYNIASPGGNPHIADGIKPDTRVIIAKLDETANPTGMLETERAAATDDLRRVRMADAADRARELAEVQIALADNARKDLAGNRRAAIEKAANTDDRPNVPSDADALAAGTAGHEPLYLVVAGGDPEAVRDDVLSLLSAKGLTYSRVPVAKAGFKRQATEQQQAQGAALADAGKTPRPAPRDEKAADKGAANGVDKAEELRRQLQPGSAAASGGLAGTPQPAATSPIAAKPAPKPELAEGGMAYRAASAMEEVVIVRRVPRSRAAELIAAMHQPSAARYAQSYPSPRLDALDALGQRDAVAFGGAAKQLQGDSARPNAPVVAAPAAKKSVAVGEKAPAIMSPTPKPADTLAEVGANTGGPDAGGQRGGSPPAGPGQSAAAAAPSTRELAKISPPPGAAPKPAGQPLSAAGQGGATARSADGTRERTTGNAAPAKPENAPAAALPARPISPPSSPPPRPAYAEESQRLMQSANASTQTSNAKGDSRPLSPGEALELVYLDIRRGGQPVAQPMAVSPKGTIFVAGFGEFALAGLTPSDAAAKLSAQMRGKNAESKGVEIRRSGAEAEMALGGGLPEERTDPASVPPAGVDKSKPQEMAQRPVQSPTPLPAVPMLPGTPPPAALPSPVTPAATSEEDYVDLVIVVQKDVAAEKASDER